MKFYHDKNFWIGFALGGSFYCIISILFDIVRLAKLYANGVFVLP